MISNLELGSVDIDMFVTVQSSYMVHPIQGHL
jgi:hypothetical protein